MKTRNPIKHDPDLICSNIWDLQDAIEAYQNRNWMKRDKSPTIAGLATSIGLTEQQFRDLAQRGDDYRQVVQLALDWDKDYHYSQALTKKRHPQAEMHYLNANHGTAGGMGGEATEIRVIIDESSRPSPTETNSSQAHKVIRRRKGEQNAKLH